MYKDPRSSSFTGRNVAKPTEPATMPNFTLPSNVQSQNFFEELKVANPDDKLLRDPGYNKHRKKGSSSSSTEPRIAEHFRRLNVHIENTYEKYKKQNKNRTRSRT
ncbi:hypothetical protein [Aquimarina sp. RZ0]|uniref:hypothetical protein n=1 Tax=Aquimarina sp. RZ0 TaxID=2607730 RepID=UPI0011F25914|nr:hypothetical protein [Aquimarina sp. RZ0]KAA1243056.1 hypothetical protein F0000_22860 [Aquimarina sp. RZ0]